MTGAEHYQMAEIALDAASATQGERLAYTPTEALLDAVAHATLALRDELAAFRRELVKAVGLVPGAMP